MIKMILTSSLILFSTLALIFPVVEIKAQGSRKSIMSNKGCEVWQAKIDPKIESSDIESWSNPKDDRVIVEAIGCLLKLKGIKRHSVFPTAGTSIENSISHSAPSVEIAALYYISYIYYQKWDHGFAMILVDKSGKHNSKESIKIAYKAYSVWYKKLQKEGTSKMREIKYDPLDGTDIHWY